MSDIEDAVIINQITGGKAYAVLIAQYKYDYCGNYYKKDINGYIQTIYLYRESARAAVDAVNIIEARESYPPLSSYRILKNYRLIIPTASDPNHPIFKKYGIKPDEAEFLDEMTDEDILTILRIFDFEFASVQEVDLQI